MSKNKASIKNRIYRKIHWIIRFRLFPGNRIRIAYPAYLHGKKYAKKHGKKIDELVNDKDFNSDVYFTQVINEGAGIGHQISNFNAGLHYSQIFGARHAYIPFTAADWDEFLGFGHDEKSVKELKKQGYKIKRIPYFNEEEDFAIIKNIVDSYNGEKVILRAELDQFYQKQCEVMPTIKAKFETAPSRKNDKLCYDSEETNIAVHIRRGDIVEGQITGEQTLTKRWLDDEYFVKVLEFIKDNLKFEKPLHIYVFSQGEGDYSFFEKYGKVTTCMDMPAIESFLHMVRADVLVTSRSSFSYKPALLSDGIRICPDGFWHEYPEDDKWIVMKV